MDQIFCKYLHALRKREHTKTGQCWIPFSLDVFLISIQTHTLKYTGLNFACVSHRCENLSFILRKDQGLKVFKNRQEVTGGWTK
jgi:hypothetical protein